MVSKTVNIVVPIVVILVVAAAVVLSLYFTGNLTSSDSTCKQDSDCDDGQKCSDSGACVECDSALCGGLTCCSDGQQCSDAGECCDDTQLCGGVCCSESQQCVDDAVCCDISLSCGDNCCSDGQTCDGDGECCDEAQICGDSCCSGSESCCNDTCCTADQTCCDGVCCDTDETCCDGTCCEAGETCCNGVCCGSGQQCVDDACCDTPADPSTHVSDVQDALNDAMDGKSLANYFSLSVYDMDLADHQEKSRLEYKTTVSEPSPYTSIVECSEAHGSYWAYVYMTSQKDGQIYGFQFNIKTSGDSSDVPTSIDLVKVHTCPETNDWNGCDGSNIVGDFQVATFDAEEGDLSGDVQYYKWPMGIIVSPKSC